eukprot:1328738-Rhodomonas_salina.6
MGGCVGKNTVREVREIEQMGGVCMEDPSMLNEEVMVVEKPNEMVAEKAQENTEALDLGWGKPTQRPTTTFNTSLGKS